MLHAMEPDEQSQRQYGEYGQPVEPTFGQKLKKWLGPVGIVFVVAHFIRNHGRHQLLQLRAFHRR